MRTVAAVTTLIAALAATGAAQAPPPDPAAERREAFPNINVYLPEGEMTIRLRRLIRNVLFEGQIDYEFVDGDVSTFLRYKYYARNFTYKIGVFDSIEFAAIESGSRDFDRVRGGLLLFDYPLDYNNRWVLLVQVDGLSYGDVTKPDNNRSNIYTKIGYQYGTPFDERLNSIAGESRGRINPVLTAYRDIGPQKLGVAVALTQGIEAIGGDYDYTKLQAEALKRFDFRSSGSFVISRLHAGSLLRKEHLEGREDRPRSEQYSAPRYELFRLGARDALKGVDGSVRGTEEAHVANELFYPIFRNQERRFLRATWTNLYGIGYSGAGAVGFSASELARNENLVVDAGLGFEASLRVREYDVYLTAVYAHTVKAPPEIEGGEIRFSVRTNR
jgi:hypothetical protein